MRIYKIKKKNAYSYFKWIGSLLMVAHRKPASIRFLIIDPKLDRHIYEKNIPCEKSTDMKLLVNQELNNFFEKFKWVQSQSKTN